MGARAERDTDQGMVLQSRVAELERRNAELELLAAAAAHELMVPLMTIEGHAELLAADVHAPWAREELGAVVRAVARMRAAVELLQQQARAEWNAIEPDRVELGAVAHDTVAALEHGLP